MYRVLDIYISTVLLHPPPPPPGHHHTRGSGLRDLWVNRGHGSPPAAVVVVEVAVVVLLLWCVGLAGLVSATGQGEHGTGPPGPWPPLRRPGP